MVLVQDLVSDVEHWSAIALTARVPVIGVHDASFGRSSEMGASGSWNSSESRSIQANVGVELKGVSWR